MKTIYTVGKYEVVYSICEHVYFIRDTEKGAFVNKEYMKHYAIKLANKLAEQ